MHDEGKNVPCECVCNAARVHGGPVKRLFSTRCPTRAFIKAPGLVGAFISLGSCHRVSDP